MKFMQHNESLGTIPKEQSCSRKGHSAAITALNKVLTTDIMRQKKQAGYICSNDATQCYDRILHNVAMMCMVRLGACMTVLLSLFGQLQQGEFKTMTGLGTSSATYGGTSRSWRQLLPMQGAMQGNGMGPVIWLAISVLLITIMNAEGYGVNFTAALSLGILQMCCFMFVDDCDLVQTTKDPQQSAMEGLQRFQAAVDCWSGCLQVTGGAIKPGKSFWYLLDWKWTGSSWSPLTKEEAPREITIRTAQGHRVALRRCEPKESNLTLGIQVAMDGNQKGEKAYLRQHAVEFADRYRTAGGLTKNDAWEGIVTRIMATFSYGAAATQLTSKDWDFISAPVFQIGLPKAGISRMFPRDVLYGPTKYQGMGLMHPFHNQELEHLAILLFHSTHKTPTGELLQHSWELL